MARDKKERLPTSHDRSPAGGFFAAFGGLSAEGLPPGEEPAQGDPSTPSGKSRGRAILRKETAHRGGKTVLVIRFEPMPNEAELARLAKELRVACGCGGAVKEGEIELQGRQLEKVRELLVGEGFRLAGITKI
ncbi:MAG TPA: translation initiation factor [Chthoniobacteraceae bacterium]|nr:translation initiation factor [Chthoniobacteraceae bacterium]